MPSPVQPNPDGLLNAIREACGSPAPHEWGDWRWQLENSITDPEWVAEALQLPWGREHEADHLLSTFPMSVTPYYLSLVQRADWRDPILRQCVPDPAELRNRQAASPDPLAEERDSPVPGLVHRYPDRALLVTTNWCATHCRHCMRKRTWSTARYTHSVETLEPAFAYLQEHAGIREVIVSGGDPLLLPETVLSTLLERIHAIPSVEVIRIGTRLPVVLPQRFTSAFCERLAAWGPVWVATHFNHPAELTTGAIEACGRLCRAGIPIVNQTVLLRGVNDRADVLRELFTGLLRARVKPYYLFHGDPVAGALHFRTGVEKGLALMAELQGRLSGLALPTFAIDLPDGHGKVRLHPTGACGISGDGAALYKSYRDATVRYT